MALDFKINLDGGSVRQQGFPVVEIETFFANYDSEFCFKTFEHVYGLFDVWVENISNTKRLPAMTEKEFYYFMVLCTAAYRNVCSWLYLQGELRTYLWKYWDEICPAHVDFSFDVFSARVHKCHKTYLVNLTLVIAKSGATGFQQPVLLGTLKELRLYRKLSHVDLRDEDFSIAEHVTFKTDVSPRHWKKLTLMLLSLTNDSFLRVTRDMFATIPNPDALVNGIRKQALKLLDGTDLSRKKLAYEMEQIFFEVLLIKHIMGKDAE